MRLPDIHHRKWKRKMTELEQAWKEYTNALSACCKYLELAVMNTELCVEACDDTIFYTERASQNLKQVVKDSEDLTENLYFIVKEIEWNGNC